MRATLNKRSKVNRAFDLAHRLYFAIHRPKIILGKMRTVGGLLAEYGANE